jgi:hypothetical protein
VLLFDSEGAIGLGSGTARGSKLHPTPPHLLANLRLATYNLQPTTLSTTAILSTLLH